MALTFYFCSICTRSSALNFPFTFMIPISSLLNYVILLLHRQLCVFLMSLLFHFLFVFVYNFLMFSCVCFLCHSDYSALMIFPFLIFRAFGSECNLEVSQITYSVLKSVCLCMRKRIRGLDARIFGKLS